MADLNQMKQEIKEITSTTGFDELTFIIDSKFSLLQHCLLHGTDELSTEEITGLSLLVADIRDGVSQMAELCRQTESYFYYVDNPKVVAEN